MLLIQPIFGIFSSLLIFQFVTRLVVGEFYTPPDGVSDLTYQRGSLIQLAWNSSLRRVALTLWTESSNIFEYLPNSGNIVNTNSYPWMVGSSKDISTNIFRFFIFDPGNTTAAFDSNYFSITDTSSSASAAQVTSATSISTATVVTTTSSTSTNSATATTASSILDPTQSLNPTQSPNLTPSATPAAKSGLSTGQKTGIGIGIGIGVGVPLLLAVGILAGWKFASSRKRPSTISTPFTISTPLTAMTNAQPTNLQEVHEWNPNEMYSAPPIGEMEQALRHE